MLSSELARSHWHEYTRTRSPRLREAIIRDYAGLARRAVDRLNFIPWGCVDREDLLGHAVIGLLDAVDRYDPALGTAFEAFAMPRIRGAVLDALRHLDWMPRSVRAEESRLRNAMGRLEARLGRPPTDAELANALEITQAELQQLMTDVARGMVLSLDDLVSGSGDPTTLGDLTASRGPDPFASGVQSEACVRLAEAIAALPAREQQVVSLYYYHELTLKEIGKVLGVTEQRVSQLHARAVLRLSHKLIRHETLLTTMAA